MSQKINFIQFRRKECFYYTNRAFYGLLLLSVFFISCDKRYIPSYTHVFIVEGSIEEGGYPQVILGQSIPINSELSEVDLNEYPVAGAKVTVSDGEKEYLLTGRFDGKYFPPYVYTTSELKGELGKVYTLRIEYQGKVLTAETTIPPVIPLDTIWASPCADSDLYQIKAVFRDPKDEKNYYKVFTQILNKESCFYSSFLGVIDDSALGEVIEIPIHRGMKFTDNNEFTPCYEYEDVVHVKFAQISREAFDFWSSYENEVNFSSNLFFPVLQSLPSNIQGGKGIWCGYGSYVVTVNIASEINPLNH